MAPLLEPDGSARFLMLIEMMVSSIEQSALGNGMQSAGVFVPLTLPMPLREYPTGKMPKHRLSHPELDALKDLWTTIRGNRTVPNRSEFDLERSRP